MIDPLAVAVVLFIVAVGGIAIFDALIIRKIRQLAREEREQDDSARR